MKFYFHDWNNVLSRVKDAIPESDLASPQDADVVVMFADCRGPLREMAERARMMGKKVYVVQHGRAATRDYQPPVDAKLIADKYLCWGQADYDRMAKLGYADRTVIVGCPMLSHMKPKVAHKEKNVLFLPVNADHEQPENLIVYYDLLKMSLTSAQEFLQIHKPELHEHWEYNGKKGVSFHDMSKFTLISKVLPLHAAKLYHGNVIQTAPGGPGHAEQLFDVLANVDCMVGLDESTTEILAMACDIPVVICDEFQWEKLGGSDYSTVELIKTVGVDRVPRAILEGTVMRALEDPDFKKEQRAEVVAYELGLDKGDPVHNILREIGALELAKV